MTATTAIYILGKTHKLNPYSAISLLCNTQHYMWYGKDLHKELLKIPLSSVIHVLTYIR